MCVCVCVKGHYRTLSLLILCRASQPQPNRAVSGIQTEPGRYDQLVVVPPAAGNPYVLSPQTATVPSPRSSVISDRLVHSYSGTLHSLTLSLSPSHPLPLSLSFSLSTPTPTHSTAHSVCWSCHNNVCALYYSNTI